MHKPYCPTRARTSMDDAILKAAKHVYDHLDDDVDISVELELLQSNIEGNGELNCDGFVLDIETVADTYFYDSEMKGMIDEDVEINDSSRLEFMRDRLKSRLEDPIEDSPSISSHDFKIDKDRTLHLCGLVTINGHSPVVNWMTPCRTREENWARIQEMGLVDSDEEIDSIPDSKLFELWK